MRMFAAGLYKNYLELLKNNQILKKVNTNFQSIKKDKNIKFFGKERNHHI